MKDGVTGVLVAPQSPEGLANGVEALIADPDRRRTLGEGGRLRVVEQFTILGHVALMRNLYLSHLTPTTKPDASC